MELKKFREYSVSRSHERFIFPYLCGTYFTYRKIDVMRVVAIAKSISSHPKYLDVGCGYGDFLARIREFIPNATGIEKDANIFYRFNKIKPDHINTVDISWGKEKFDVVFVGWMDPGVDYRRYVANKTSTIVTTLDEGISLAAEYEDLGFHRVAWWRTPAWIDVNYEIMNKYYTKMTKDTYEQLHKLRGAHNLWYVYSDNYENFQNIKNALTDSDIKYANTQKYDFEEVLDETGFRFLESFSNARYTKLWEINFSN